MKTIISLIIVVIYTCFLCPSCTKKTIDVPSKVSVRTGDEVSLVLMVVTRRTVSINENVGGFVRILPSNYSTAKKYPLLISLHGLEDVGNGSYTSLAKIESKGVPYYIVTKKFPSTLTVNGQTFSFVVIAPQFKAWPSNTDVNNVLDFCLKYYSVDVSRIYLTGLSMGGGAVWEYARGYPQRITAIAPMAGASAPNTAKAKTIADNGVVVWAFHNDRDPSVSVNNTNTYITYVNNYKPLVPAKKTILISNQHDCWSKAAILATNPAV